MLKHVCVVAGWLVACTTGVALAQEDCAGPWLTQPQYDALPIAEKTQEFQRLVDCTKKSVAEEQQLLGVVDNIKLDEYTNALDSERERLNGLLESRTAALGKANDEIAALVHQRDDLTKRLAQTTDDLKRAEANKKDAWAKIADLNGQIAALTADRDKLAAALDAEKAARKAAEDKIAGLAQQLADAQGKIDALVKENGDLKATIAADEVKIGELGTQIDGLNAEVTRLNGVVDTETNALKIANDKNDYLTKARDRLNGEVAAANDKIKGLEGTVAELTTQRDNLQKLADALTQERDALKMKLGDVTKERDTLKVQVADLTTERDGLKVQVADLTSKLDKANAKIAELGQQVANLTKERDDLKVALAAANARIADLEGQLGTWRGLFFGRLLDILGKQTGVEIVGDRFVFQSEVLFDTGSALLKPEGRQRIIDVAKALQDIEDKIPADISWVLQVNGHTDIQKFRSSNRDNWDLSWARAIAVVRLLIEQGVDPHHLAAAGFGEYEPRDTGTTPEALAKNRRIELKLTDDGPLAK